MSRFLFKRKTEKKGIIKNAVKNKREEEREVEMTFYFAWCHEEESFDPEVHARQDESLFSLEISGQEAKYPTAYVQLICTNSDLM